MLTAKDILVPAATVPADLSVRALAAKLLAERLDGVLVLRDNQLVGVVTTMDLVFRESEIHAPTVVALFDLVVQLGAHRTQRELTRMTSRTVGELMVTDLVTATPETTLSQLSTWMVERHLSVLPVIDAQSRLVGMVTKVAIVEAVLRRAAEPGDDHSG